MFNIVLLKYEYIAVVLFPSHFVLLINIVIHKIKRKHLEPQMEIFVRFKSFKSTPLSNLILAKTKPFQAGTELSQAQLRQELERNFTTIKIFCIEL